MPTPLGLPLIPDSTKISAFPEAARQLATALDTLVGNQTANDRGALPANANLNTLFVTGDHRAERGSVVTTITGRPAGTTQPFTVKVTALSVANGVYLQELTEYAATGPKTNRRISLAKEYGTWSGESDKWDRGPLARNTALDTLFTTGLHRAESYSIVQTITGKPAGTAQPFSIEVQLLSALNSVYLQILTEYAETGPKVSRRFSLAGEFQDWKPESAGGGTAPGTGIDWSLIATYGDSLTAGGSAGDAWADNESWPARLNALLPGLTVTNRGRSGDTTDEVMIRAGAMPLRFTVPAGGIPTAATAVTLKTRQAIASRTGRWYAGTIAGIYGTLRATEDPATWTFTRAAAGMGAVATGSLTFTASDPAAAAGTLMFWAGRNDVSFGTPGPELNIVQHVLAKYEQFVDWAGPERNVLLAGVTLSEAEKPGTPGHTAITAINDALRLMRPGRFIDVNRWLSQDALQAMGLTPTPADTAAAAAGLIPPQLYADGLHFTRAVADALAGKFFEPLLAAKGII